MFQRNNSSVAAIIGGVSFRRTDLCSLHAAFNTMLLNDPPAEGSDKTMFNAVPLPAPKNMYFFQPAAVIFVQIRKYYALY